MIDLRDVEAVELLVERLRAGDPRAYQEFAAAFGPFFRRRFLRCGLPLQEAEDLAESCVIDVALRIHKYDPGAGRRFIAWAVTVADRLRIDRSRRQRPSQVKMEVELADPHAQQALAEVELRGYEQVLGAALSRLKPEERAILELRGLDGAGSYEKAAEQLCITVETARTRYFRARKHLIEQLRRDRDAQELGFQ